MRKRQFPGNRFWGDEEPTPQRVLGALEATLRNRLPSSWSVVVSLTEGDPSTKRGLAELPDATVTIASPDGYDARVVVEAKRRLDPKLIPVVAAQLERHTRSGGETVGMAVAPFLSPRAREILARMSVAYADATGNLRLAIERPALYIETTGALSDPWARPGDRPLRSLKGPTAGRVVRALCDFRPPFQVQQLAKRSGTSLGSVSRVFAFLEPEGLITREPRGPVTEVRWADLIRRWAQDYTFARANTTRTFLEPRGVSALLQKLRAGIVPYVITGSLAAVQVAPVASPRLAALYVDDVERAGELLGLRRAETGANALLAEPFDAVVFERVWERDGLTYAALTQVAADLLTGPGRGPSEGDELIRWMQNHEDAWRS